MVSRNELKICVAGLGGVGGLIAARLAGSGCKVSALVRGANLQAVRDNGLTLIDGPQDARRHTTVKIEASDDPHALGSQDVLIIAVKATALGALASTIGPLIGPQTAIVPAMNGVPWWFLNKIGGRWQGASLKACDPDGSIARALPAEQLLGCVVHLSAALTEPGVVTHRAGDRLILGTPGGQEHPMLSPLADVLAVAGFQTEKTQQIELETWLKLWGNMTVNPISVLTGATGDKILDDDFVRDYMSACMLEAAKIGESIGLPIDMTPQERHAVTRKLGALRTSMLSDAEAGRALELDALVGAVVELGRMTGVPTPSIDSLFGLTRLYGRVHGVYPSA